MEETAQLILRPSAKSADENSDPQMAQISADEDRLSYE